VFAALCSPGSVDLACHSKWVAVSRTQESESTVTVSNLLSCGLGTSSGLRLQEANNRHISVSIKVSAFMADKFTG